MELFQVFSHGSIKIRAENVQRHRYHLQALHSLLGNHLAGKMEILHAPIDNNPSWYRNGIPWAHIPKLPVQPNSVFQMGISAGAEEVLKAIQSTP